MSCSCTLRLGLRRIVRSTARAADQKAVHLILLGMEQDRAASAARVVHRMIARLEHRRSVQNASRCRRGDSSETDLTGGHSYAPLCRRERYGLSATDAWRMAVVGDFESMRLLTGAVCIELLTRMRV